jgi:phytoene desaturase
MNYVDFVLGTWYPEGGFSKVASAMAEVALSLGVTIHTDHEVTKIVTDDNRITKVITTNGQEFLADVFVSGSPYYYTESLLPQALRQYSDSYWDSRVLAPSCLNFYLGIDRPLPNLRHHTFFFDQDWQIHFDDTYGPKPKWQDNPLFYAHVASKTDQNVAPKDCETLYILIPVAAGLKDTEPTRQRLRTNVVERLNSVIGFDLNEHIVTERSYAHNDFIADYHAQKGSGFGLGHTLMQTAAFRPKNRSTKVPNLYFTGQDTIPGTSTIMSIISGKVTSERITQSQ